ncbi:MAG TPA: peptidase C15 [Thermodesulfovibrionia bacterium]|nr:peptidase C15 [Thermodesulfovibrionia bacterium]
MKVLLTGFNPFAGLRTNPSQLIVEEIGLRAKLLSDIHVTAQVLPTEFEAAGSRIQDLIHTVAPDLVLSLGTAASQSVLTLERVALNLDDSTLPDNAGVTHEAKTIAHDGPPAYFSTLPLQYLKTELHQKGIPVKISNHAGTYVCNHVFYLALHQINKLQTHSVCGFIHVPLVSGNSIPFGKHTITLHGLVVAIEYCLKIIYNGSS